MADDIKFVTIELHRNQVDTTNLVHNEKTGKDYAKIYAPEGGVLFYPISSIRVRNDNPDRVFFSRPEGTELHIRYSIKKDGVDDNAPNNEKYENTTRIWKIEDLKQAYDEAKKEYAETHGYVSYTIPTSWGRKFMSNDTEYVSISFPIMENGKNVYYSFITKSDYFRESTREEGMSYFSFPKTKKDSHDEYNVTLMTSVKKEDGEYENIEKTINSLELKKYVDEAVGRYKNRSEVKSHSLEEEQGNTQETNNQGFRRHSGR